MTSVLCVLIDFTFGHDLQMLGASLLGGRSIPVQISWLLWTRVHGSVVRAVDCRSAGPWFNSGWRSWFTFMTCSHNPMNQISQMFISKSPITRKSVKMVAEHRNGTALCSAVDTSCMVVAADPHSWITQWFGVLTWAERPAAVYLATGWKQVRRVPGRPTGESLDKIPFDPADPRAAH